MARMVAGVHRSMGFVVATRRGEVELHPPGHAMAPLKASSVSTGAESTMSLRFFRALLIALVAATAAVDGARAAYIPQGDNVAPLLGLILCIAFPLLCQVDSWILKRPVYRIFVVLTFFAWPVLFPVYLIWSRGWKGALLLVASIFLLFADFALAFVVVRYALHGSLELGH